MSSSAARSAAGTGIINILSTHIIIIIVIVI